jgi:uncharacterized protein
MNPGASQDSLESEPAGSNATVPGRVPASEIVELTREECLALLASNGFGRLAVNIGEGPPVIRPVNYRFDPSSQSVVFRTAAGSKFHALVRSAQAAFEIDGVDERARTGWSVVVRGVTGEVANPNDLRRLDGLALETWAPGPKPHWMQIRAWTVSGRRIIPSAQPAPGRHG